MTRELIKEPSAKELILSYLQEGNTLTALQAWRMWGILTCLSSRIAELRKEGRKKGYQIITTTITRNKKHFAQYSLTSKLIKK